MINDLILLNPEVENAIRNNLPIVALESTIISHGMPWPQNVETAKIVEDIVRNEGAIPATIAIKDGKCLVGLSHDNLEYFGRSNNVWKVSLRDMPYVLSNKISGATTVAATMRIAAMCGIKIFATGGIGGVHRNASVTMDISADLTEMSNTNVAIVSAGVKSILDIGLTLEYLETMGVPVVTIGQDDFPSFYSSKSGFKSPLRIDNLEEIAKMVSVKWELGLNGSILIANPVPLMDEVENEKIEHQIQAALLDSQEKNISGKEVTPFLLKYISDNTNGESLQTNISLIKNNALIAAKIAKNLY